MLLHQKDPSHNSDKDNMKYYILSILLIASVSLIIPDSFAEIERGKNYDKEILTTNPDGSPNDIRYSFLLSDRILDNGIYKDYIFTETADTLKIQTARDFISLDKNSCSFNFDDIFTDSIVAFNSIVDLYSWKAINQINTATCEAYYDITERSLVAKRYASNVGYMEYKYIFNGNAWKTQLEATNLTTLTDRVFAFDQTIDLNSDSIFFGGSQRNLDNFSGRTFDRIWLENNKAKVINFLIGVQFDFDLGFDNLDSISITNTGTNKSKLTFHYMKNNNILMPNDTLIIDPAYTSDWSDAGYVDDYASLGTCDTGSAHIGGPATIRFGAAYTGVGTDCSRAWIEFDISSADPTWTVSDVIFEAEMTAPTGTGRDGNIYHMNAQPSLATASDVFIDSRDGTAYVTANSDLNGAGVVAIDLGTSADTDLTTAFGLSQTWFGLGFATNDESLPAPSTHALQNMDTGGGVPEPKLTITYSVTGAPTPDSIVDLTLDSVTQTTATVSFTIPNYNTGNLTTNTFNLDTPQNNNVLTFFANSTDNPFTFTGLTLGTSYSANATVITEGGGNYTLANILNFTTSTYVNPGTPTLSASALSDTAIRYTSVPGTAGDNSTIWFSMQCELNGAGGWLNTVNNDTYTTFYEVTGLTLGDVNICQWRDGSVDGWSGWSNNATDVLALAILSAQRGIADTDDKLMQFINMVSGMGGVYFGLGVLPFGIMLIGFMAGKKIVRIFTLATLMLMGIVHASGYYVYPNWYWTLCLLFGLVLIMGRMKSD